MCDADRRDHRPCQSIARSVFKLEFTRANRTIVRQFWGACEEHREQVLAWVDRCADKAAFREGVTISTTEERI